MIREDVGHSIGVRNALPGNGGERAVGADHHARADSLRVFRRLRTILDHSRSVGVASEALEGAIAALGSEGGRTFPQPLVEHFAIHHAHEAVDRHVDVAVTGRDHPGRSRAGDQQCRRDFELFNEPRRDGATARLDPASAIEQQH